MSDYIPGKDAEFGPWAHNLVDYAKANATRLGIPALEFAALDAYLANWDEDYAKATAANHTAAEIAQKNETRHVLETGLRAFVNQFIRYNIAVTVADRVSMGLTVPDTTQTPEAAPTIHVGFSLNIHAVYELELRFWVLETGKHAVPKNMNGVVVYWQVSDTPVTDQADLASSRLLTRHIEVLPFLPAERGKTVYIACRWENNTGKRGDWSPIQSFVVP
jgi:hypothetical protein